MNLLNNVFYFVIILAIMFAADISQADKHSKKGDTHKNKQNQQQTNKNSTMSHDNKNHTSINTNHTVPNQNSMFINNEQQAAQSNNPSNIGWSLNQNQAQNHQNNPNGYVMQHHDNSHSTSHLNQQNSNIQPQQQQQGSSNFGGIALGAAGGLASGALGGKCKTNKKTPFKLIWNNSCLGYLLSNALNSGGKSGEKGIEAPVQNISETTVSISQTSPFESSTLTVENNTLSSTSEINEILNHTDSSTITQSTQRPPESNKASSVFKLSIYVCAFLSLFIKISLWNEYAKSLES